MSTFDLTVVICSNNPRQAYLQRVLDALRDQTLPLDRWELLLVDNKSDVPLSERFDLSWHSAGRHMLEPRMGKSHALMTAMENASSPVLLIVDDDNVLSPTYLERGLSLGKQHPELGCWGPARIEGEFEIAPPEELQPHLHMLALFCNTEDKIASDHSVMPPGAGLFFRLEASRPYQDLLKNDDLRKSFGSRGSAFFRGEDTDMVMSMLSEGWKAGCFVDLSLIHLIPKTRLTKDYFLRLARSNGACSLLVDWLWGGTRYKKPFWDKTLSLLRIYRLPRTNRDFSLAYWKGEHDARRFIRQSQAAHISPPTRHSLY